MTEDDVTKHALGRFFSRYKYEITVEELKYIQKMIKFKLDDIEYLGRFGQEEPDDYCDYYHGIFMNIEFFALCAPGTSRIITFLTESQTRNFLPK